LKFLEYAPILFVSALTGQRVNQVIPAAIKVQGERQVKLTTSQLNKVLHAAQDRQPPPSHAGQQFRIYYATQVRTDPPTFLVYVNNPDLAHFTYLRYLENRIRDDYPFLGTPIRIVLRPRKR
jgi:GTP-binding protein